MTRQVLDEMRQDVRQLDNSCWHELRGLLHERDRCCSGERKSWRVQAAETSRERLQELESAYRGLLVALVQSGANTDEIERECAELSSRHAMQRVLVEDVLGLECPLKPFEEIAGECRCAIIARQRNALSVPRQLKPPLGSSFKLSRAAVWGRLEQEWVSQDPESKRNVDELREGFKP